MQDHPLSPFVSALARGKPLSAEDKAALLALPHKRRTVPPLAYLLREGEPAISCVILLSGYAFRHKLAASGARQIMSIHIAGDALDFQSLYLPSVDHNVQAMTAADVAVVPMSALRDLIAERPAVGQAVFRHLLVEASILREWLLNVGRRNARERIAHLLCEFGFRLDARGIGVPGTYELPMTQEQIGDAVGLTSVHVNRSLRALEEEGLVKRQGRIVSFPDTTRLRHVADFSELYLHQPAS